MLLWAMLWAVVASQYSAFESTCEQPASTNMAAWATCPVGVLGEVSLASDVMRNSLDLDVRNFTDPLLLWSGTDVVRGIYWS